MEVGQRTSNILVPQEWPTESIVSSTAPIAFICGPENCGKTIFSLHLVNALLERHEKVAYLDTDVDRAVFTPHGLLSLTVIDKIIPDLTSPPLKTPERCLFFGDTSSQRKPEMHLSFTSNLFDHYMKEYCTKNKTNVQGGAGLPLVINTCGYVSGMDFKMLVGMIKYMSPTHVVKIQIPLERKNLPAGAFWMSEGIMDTTRVIEMNAALQSVQVQKDASGLRDSRTTDYFMQCFPGETITDIGYTLACHAPYEIHVSSLRYKHVRCKVPETEIYHLLNVSIVGLAISSDVSEPLYPCVGLGLVRIVDARKGLLYIITPVPQETLESVDLLLQGFMRIPLSFLTYEGGGIPFKCSATPCLIDTLIS